MNMPLNVKMYKHMNGVDRHDQLRTQYMVGRFSNKAWKCLLWFFVDASIVNAWIVYQEISTRSVPKKRYSQLDFRVEIAKGLIANYSSCREHHLPFAFWPRCLVKMKGGMLMHIWELNMSRLVLDTQYSCLRVLSTSTLHLDASCVMCICAKSVIFHGTKSTISTLSHEFFLFIYLFFFF